MKSERCQSILNNGCGHGQAMVFVCATAVLGVLWVRKCSQLVWEKATVLYSNDLFLLSLVSPFVGFTVTERAPVVFVSCWHGCW